MLHKVIEMETVSLIRGAGACLLDLPRVGKAHLSLAVILSESVVSWCELGGNRCSRRGLVHQVGASRPRCEHQLGAFPAAGARLLRRGCLCCRGGKGLTDRHLLKTAALNLLSYKIEARYVGKSVGCPNM